MDTIRADKLDIKHSTWLKHAPHWRTIRDLKDGMIQIGENLPRYLPIRPDEDQELYKARLDKTAYTPVMGNTIAKYISRLLAAPIHLDVDDVWESFRENNRHPALPPRNEKQLLQELFGSLLYYGVTYAVIDQPATNFTPRSLAESEQFNPKPYVTVLNPLEVINYGDGWYIVSQVFQKVMPFEPAQDMVRWTFYTDKYNAVYEAPALLREETDKLGNKYNKVHRIRIDDEWVPLDDKRALLTPVITHHGSAVTITHIKVPGETWLCQQLYPKQVQHLRIENSWTDAGYLSGIVQRVFTPPDAPPADDPRQYYEQPDYNKELAKAGNAHILIGKQYSFVESPGAALANLEKMLDKIEGQIKYLVGLHFASGEKGAVEQSGISKTMDMSFLQDSMSYYGAMCLALYNNILRIVADLSGWSEAFATGLSNYNIDSLDTLLEQLTTVETLPTVPETAKKIAYGKLSEMLAGSLSPEEKEAIHDELEYLFSDDALEDDIAELFGISEDEANKVRG
jgi:hypothetical protein